MPSILAKIKKGTILRFKEVKSVDFTYIDKDNTITKINFNKKSKGTKKSTSFFGSSEMAEVLRWDENRSCLNLVVYGIYSSYNGKGPFTTIEEISHSRMASDYRIFLLIQFPNKEFTLVPGSLLRYVC